MPLPLPNLDDRTYADLVGEARARLPAYCPTWTDHNASDPGIMLVELFAWLAEMMLYRANRVPQRHVVTFLKLLNGPDWRPSKDVAEDVRAAVLSLRQPWRAVTVDDYERLAVEAVPGQIARAHCLARRDLSAPDEKGKTAPRPGHVSVIVVPPSAAPLPPGQEPLVAVEKLLAERRLVTTRLHVVGPQYVRIDVGATVVRRGSVSGTAESLRKDVAAAVAAFLDPLKGGPVAGQGWPFGGAVYLSDLYPVLQAVPAVASIEEIRLSSPSGGVTELRHSTGALVGLALSPHHLPKTAITPADVSVEDPDDSTGS